ncbi:MAG TPA: amidohydrolase family protein [bacterium]|nr:amidohydrolase family protein [bacterium]
MILDVHAHVFPDRFLAALDREGGRYGAKVEARGGDRIVWSSPHQRATIGPVFWDVGERLAALDRWGITMQALSLSPPMLYWAPPDLGRELAAVFNDEVAAIARAHPPRFLAFATLPLQDVRAAVAEAERAARAGCRALYVGTNVNGRYLDDPSFAPLWDCAVRHGLPVFTHPLNNAGEDRMSGWHLGNSVGNPGETALAAARLILSGTLDRYPELRLVLAHGAGSLPFLLGRLDHTYAVRAEVRDAIPAPPSAYLRRMYADTITHSDRALGYLVEAAGPARVLLGTDLPYDMADERPVERVNRLGLGPDETRAILGDNGARLLGLTGAGTVHTEHDRMTEGGRS